MERTLDFSDVISYDFSLAGPNMVLELSQPDVTTTIKIAVGSIGRLAVEAVSSQPPTEDQRPAIVGGRVKRAKSTKMTADSVREIRANWDQTVKACGTKNAAAERLAKIYGCSAKNIYAIIYKYSWAHV
jgi:hypothetical protein